MADVVGDALQDLKSRHKTIVVVADRWMPSGPLRGDSLGREIGVSDKCPHPFIELFPAEASVSGVTKWLRRDANVRRVASNLERKHRKQVPTPKLALMATTLSEQEFQDYVRVLQGMEVSLAWKGYGSAIFLELGRLSPPRQPRGQHEQGEACLCVEWDWRVENASSILFGSSDTRPEIADGIRGLQGSRINDIVAVGAVPEIVASFSNEQRLRSMALTVGDPQWAIRLPSGSWLSAKKGALWLDAKPEGSPDEYAKEIKMAEDAHERWGVPTAEPVRGNCNACDWFRPLDGDFALLEYGICIAEKSPFDGHVVARFSGCPVFRAPDEA